MTVLPEMPEKYCAKITLDLRDSLSLSPSLSLSLSLTGKEGMRTLANIKHAHILSIPLSVSQSACVIILLIMRDIGKSKQSNIFAIQY